VTVWSGFAQNEASDTLRLVFVATLRQVARWVFVITGSSHAAEIGGVPTEDLIARFQKGQPRAFEAIYDRFKDYVYRVAFFVLRNQQEAEDAVQETFLDLLKALPNYDIHGTARFETWLYRVTVNRSRMHLRRKMPPSEEWDDVEERLERMPVTHTQQPEEVLLERDRASRLWHAVNELPDTHRIAVLLRYQQNLSYEEIADVMGINVGTVKSRLYNAHAKIKGLLGQSQ
jgi:RNA polymerase sigma-70 factor (ECF subfamily)